ncbi:MAG TPA: glucosyl-3-phosphoglycerate synthase [Jatrophihabitantaceae bacterium]|nr:glucosyl-3-phosphoglycerate synthase [Jatrophihabitantaceae bacterium]
MHQDAAEWFARRTSRSADWLPERIADLKREQGVTVSVVIPARNEEHTIADVVRQIRRELIEQVPIVDELLVIDSMSDDATSERAQAEGAQVWHVADVVPQLGVAAGKGEAMWKSLFVTRGELLVFIDADLTEWGAHFVTGLLGPLLSDQKTLLVKGFYDRVSDLDGVRSTEGGRVTELVARPLISLGWPELAAVVQPLAGEWAIRRHLFEQLPVPVGYGVELATLLDTAERHGLDAIAQVDLGRRAHHHQSVHDLGVMATEILHVAQRRSGGATRPSVVLDQYDAGTLSWRQRPVPVAERPPMMTVADRC